MPRKYYNNHAGFKKQENFLQHEEKPQDVKDGEAVFKMIVNGGAFDLDCYLKTHNNTLLTKIAGVPLYAVAVLSYMQFMQQTKKIVRAEQTNLFDEKPPINNYFWVTCDVLKNSQPSNDHYIGVDMPYDKGTLGPPPALKSLFKNFGFVPNTHYKSWKITDTNQASFLPFYQDPFLNLFEQQKANLFTKRAIVDNNIKEISQLIGSFKQNNKGLVKIIPAEHVEKEKNQEHDLIDLNALYNNDNWDPPHAWMKLAHK